jgi:hypothetical protein
MFDDYKIENNIKKLKQQAIGACIDKYYKVGTYNLYTFPMIPHIIKTRCSIINLFHCKPCQCDIGWQNVMVLNEYQKRFNLIYSTFSDINFVFVRVFKSRKIKIKN